MVEIRTRVMSKFNREVFSPSRKLIVHCIKFRKDRKAGKGNVRIKQTKPNQTHLKSHFLETTTVTTVNILEYILPVFFLPLYTYIKLMHTFF